MRTTRKGRRRAKAQGKSLGRPFKRTAHQKAEAIRRREAGIETLAEMGRSCNVSGATISRLRSSN
jgi:DNA invertase Pin-like site-specific DNA recombinase